jgi:hypothetical protein
MPPLVFELENPSLNRNGRGFKTRKVNCASLCDGRSAKYARHLHEHADMILDVVLSLAVIIRRRSTASFHTLLQSSVTLFVKSSAAKFEGAAQCNGARESA